MNIEFEALLAQAHAAGQAALEAAIPTPMVVYETAGLSNQPKPNGREWYVNEGACGFAWVTLRPATTPLARYLKKTRFELSTQFDTADRAQIEAEGGHWSKAYNGGYQLWVWGGGQSITRKEAYASAYAEVLRDAGYKAYSGSRMD